MYHLIFQETPRIRLFCFNTLENQMHLGGNNDGSDVYTSIY